MFYHALTGNSGTGDLEPVLLWENSNIAAEFTPQKVNLDLTNYAGIIVEFNRANGSPAHWLANRSFIKKGETRLGAGNTESTNSADRNFSCDNTGVTFESGYVNSVESNGAIIPIKIYGVKSYVVEPIDNIQDFMANNLLGIYANDETGTANLTINPSECYVFDSGTNNVGNSGFKIKKGENFNYSCNYSGNTVNVTGTWSGNSLTVTRSNNFGRTNILFLK